VEAAGLAIFSEQYGYYDRFRGRLIFPIRSAKGEVVGFGGRALGDTQPKYLNTPQTLLFDKSQVLYGLDLARDDIRRTDAAVVVEGYIDVITAHQHGFRNVVAPLGTALNSNHVALLKKLSHNIYLALDADAAGQRATLRGLSAFEHAPDGPADDEAQAVVTAQGLVRWQRDITLRIITLPEGRDPDDVIKSDPQQWQSLIDNAQPVMDFYLAAYTADLDLDQPQQQHTALERLLPLLRQLDSTQQRVYVARLEQVIGIRAEIIIDLLRAAPPRPPRSQQRQRRDAHPRQEEHPSRQEESQNQNAPFPARSSASARREDYLLALLMRYPSVLEPLEVWLASNLNDAVCNLLGDSPDRLLDQTTNRIIWQTWREAGMPALVVDVPLPNGDESADPTTRQLPGWSAELDPALRGQLEHLVDFPLPQHPEYHVAQDAENCARYLRLEQARRWQRRLGQQAQDAEDSQERERLFALLGDVQRYLATINQPHRSKSWEDMRDTLRQPDEV
jgi:DNA primase